MESLEKNYIELLEKQRVLNEKLVNTENEKEMLAIIETYNKVSEECDEVSRQIDLLEQIEELKKAGAIIMQHKDLLLHKNGAKFPIAKNYIVDGLIKKDQKYTIILLPE
ncbi:MAG: hypothetical protein RBG13Loki_2611 [Promethearchaeota archaeon CR_4]|nr:MAG: hypothetical protein RBG13Loki_2611 [Candidatus Lokiarchaeota archaeon CR_4]